ncbi:uncharacterized protein LOC105447639 [Strongylocentrotus purpuratus]|uniref:Uncharacterized protein n=1 Tax=Strongylocentrotus purpuratus TaxID=7668 RepID=A0A7M7N0B9_STRPU|nr:uncharacterized protein LOC105447639 [Strongylocentrotus purpuratus]
MANDIVLRARPRRSESYNNAGACSLGMLQLLGATVTIALGVVAYVIEGSLIYYGVPIWSGSLFFLTAVTAFVSVRKTICGITTYLVTCMLSTAASAALLILYARLISLKGRYSYCDTRDSKTLLCTHYTTRPTLMIVEACTLGIFALQFTTGAIGLGLCLCGLCRRTLGRTSSIPPPQPRAAVNTHVPANAGTSAAAMHIPMFTHDIAIPTAPPEYEVAEEQLRGTAPPEYLVAEEQMGV